MRPAAAGLRGDGIKARIQRAGGFLAGMVMPNIGAFIAWGLITALFIPTGWIPSEKLAELVGPTITVPAADPDRLHRRPARPRPARRGDRQPSRPWASSSAREVADVPRRDDRRPAVGAGAARVRQAASSDRIPSGFEMLVNNFSLGILGGAHRRSLGLVGVGPVVEEVDRRRSATASRSSSTRTCCRSRRILVEPAKVLFLNNAINHGVLGPLGVAEAAETRQVDPVHDRDQPRPRPRRPARVLGRRSEDAAPDRPRRDRSSSSSAASTRSTSRTSS